MSFATALAAQKQTTVGGNCTVTLWRDMLTETDRKDFDAALITTIATSAIFRAMKETGYQYGDGAVSRHRRKECRCELR